MWLVDAHLTTSLKSLWELWLSRVCGVSHKIVGKRVVSLEANGDLVMLH